MSPPHSRDSEYSLGSLGRCAYTLNPSWLANLRMQGPREGVLLPYIPKFTATLKKLKPESFSSFLLGSVCYDF